ncbi:hypothetical protein F753_19200 [Stutzerimonas chloritidismutans AW-1]|uniref:Uncharacterized protein n=1 Tax=Stutzerimonas chloritidismutans AW-1 TaxID=1263865 RepID=V4RX55_STUCH|nr:hypothetical protein F753_19200 [Stutzerimonas chloritidismutans AW-1]
MERMEQWNFDIFAVFLLSPRNCTSRVLLRGYILSNRLCRVQLKNLKKS